MYSDLFFNIEICFSKAVQVKKKIYSYEIKSSESLSCEITLPADSLFFWANREGEIIETNKIKSKLLQYQVDSASISYPATASSCYFFIYNPKNKEAVEIYEEADLEGKIAQFSLMNRDLNPILKIDKSSLDFKVNYYSVSHIQDFIEQVLRRTSAKINLPEQKKKSNFQIQLGLISPTGEHNIPVEKGFSVCEDVAKNVHKSLGPNNIIHIFAYHGAHDSCYPEYIPDSDLGGIEGFKMAIEGIHQEKQLCSVYMNARLCSIELLEKYSELKEEVVRDAEGQLCIETYYERDFAIMNPESLIWQETIYRKAVFLKSLGVDIIQLDQVAGRAAIGEIGTIWGRGYRQLIESIQNIGLEVWIQGINEIYSVDRFELCFREANILDDGSIRGGHPFGESFALIPQILKGKKFIVPLGNEKMNREIGLKNITVDLENSPGQLSLYSNEYMENLKKNLQNRERLQ